MILDLTAGIETTRCWRVDMAAKSGVAKLGNRTLNAAVGQTANEFPSIRQPVSAETTRYDTRANHHLSLLLGRYKQK
jgi:hypothetical protein